MNRQMKTDRSLWKVILLNIITCGIYGIIFNTSIADDINEIARNDGKKTMHYCLLYFVIIPITFGIGGIVWCHNISERIGAELARRGISYSFGASTFWLWAVLGSFIFVGPLVYTAKLITAMNLLSESYNANGY